MMIDGGISRPSVPAPASEPIDDVVGVAALLAARAGSSCRWWRRWRRCEPDTAAKMAQPTTLVCSSRPGSACIQGARPRNMSWRQPRAEQDLAHPDEQRQRGQRPARRRAPDGDGHRVAGRPAAEQLHADPGHARQREADPHAAAQDQRTARAISSAVMAMSSWSIHCAAPRRWRGAATRRPRQLRAPARRRRRSSRISVPTAIASCGIHSGVASLPVEMSLNWRATATPAAAL